MGCGCSTGPISLCKMAVNNMTASRSFRSIPQSIKSESILKQFAGQKINVLAYPKDDEIAGFAKEVEAILSRAEWVVLMPTGKYDERPIFDVRIDVQPS